MQTSATRALIDGDILVYSCGFSVEKMWYDVVVDGCIASYPSKKLLVEEFCKWYDSDDWYEIVPRRVVQAEVFALHAVKEKIKSIVQDIGVKDFRIYLSGPHNFRDQVAVTKKYKGNRDESHKPVHYQAIKDYMIQEYNTHVSHNIEADDLLGINQRHDTIICTIDKDLLMIPGWHYNMNSKQISYVNEFEGILSFYTQLLTGDTADNIPGLKGIGPKTALKILNDCTTEQEMKDVCQKQYEKQGVQERLHEIATLLWIQRVNRIEWHHQSCLHRHSSIEVGTT